MTVGMSPSAPPSSCCGGARARRRLNRSATARNG